MIEKVFIPFDPSSYHEDAWYGHFSTLEKARAYLKLEFPDEIDEFKIKEILLDEPDFKPLIHEACNK